MTLHDVWTAEIRVAFDDPEAAGRLSRTLAPEAAREVPRAHAALDHPDPTTVRLTIGTRDTGALRAALNTYLGWVELAERTEAIVSATRP